MEFLVNHWIAIIIAIAIITCIGYFIYVFIKMPSTEQINKLKEWLLYAVTEAEKELGSGTGQIKLRYVYDMFIAKFPYLAKVIHFDTFSNLVDEALENFRKLLNSNKQIQNYVDSNINKEEK